MQMFPPKTKPFLFLIAAASPDIAVRRELERAYQSYPIVCPSYWKPRGTLALFQVLFILFLFSSVVFFFI